MARQLFADKSEEFTNTQLNALLSSLEIENDIHARGPMPGRFGELEDYWNESQGILKPGVHTADGWVTEFSQHRAQQGDPDAWAHSFEQQHGVSAWASEFEEVKTASGSWAAEYQQQYNGGATWADDFVHDEISRGPNRWVNEFTAKPEQEESLGAQWVNEFSKLHVDDWVEEFGHQVADEALGDSSSDHWANAYDEFLNEQVAAKQQLDASSSVYVFSDMNPYVGHPNPLKKGRDLFRKKLLSEAVLALEAEVMKNPENAEGWRLLGITHAENDDDQQAIAVMMHAQEADPINLGVLLALGVSHTNELD